MIVSKSGQIKKWAPLLLNQFFNYIEIDKETCAYVLAMFLIKAKKAKFILRKFRVKKSFLAKQQSF